MANETLEREFRRMILCARHDKDAAREAELKKVAWEKYNLLFDDM